jgi:hypothetical protein
MYSNIVLMRVRGKRRPAREIDADVGVSGCVRVVTVGTVRRASLTAWGDDALLRSIVPDLFEPVLANWVGSRLLLRG